MTGNELLEKLLHLKETNPDALKLEVATEYDDSDDGQTVETHDTIEVRTKKFYWPSNAPKNEPVYLFLE